MLILRYYLMFLFSNIAIIWEIKIEQLKERSNVSCYKYLLTWFVCWINGYLGMVILSGYRFISSETYTEAESGYPSVYVQIGRQTSHREDNSVYGSQLQ